MSFQFVLFPSLSHALFNRSVAFAIKTHNVISLHKYNFGLWQLVLLFAELVHNPNRSKSTFLFGHFGNISYLERKFMGTAIFKQFGGFSNIREIFWIQMECEYGNCGTIEPVNPYRKRN